MSSSTMYHHSNSSNISDKIHFDGFCWDCERSINKHEDFRCRMCGRGFHYSCKPPERIPKAKTTGPLQDYVLKPNNDKCQVCYRLALAEGNYRPSELPEVNRAIVLAIDRLMSLEESEPFCRPVNVDDVPNYLTWIANPMDLGTLRKRAVEEKFKSADELIMNLKLILHNSKIFNRSIGEYTKLAHFLYDKGVIEYNRLAYCYHCYLRGSIASSPNANFLVNGNGEGSSSSSAANGTNGQSSSHDMGEDFLQPCTPPHGLVWARCPANGNWTPAKIINYLENELAESTVDVCFFGSREVRNGLKLSQCYTFSESKPSLIDESESVVASSMDDALVKRDLERHLELMKSVSLLYNDLKIHGPNDTLLTHERLYLSKVFRPNLSQDEEDKRPKYSSVFSKSKSPKLANNISSPPPPSREPNVPITSPPKAPKVNGTNNNIKPSPNNNNIKNNNSIVFAMPKAPPPKPYNVHRKSSLPVNYNEKNGTMTFTADSGIGPLSSPAIASTSNSSAARYCTASASSSSSIADASPSSSAASSSIPKASSKHSHHHPPPNHARSNNIHHILPRFRQLEAQKIKIKKSSSPTPSPGPSPLPSPSPSSSSLPSKLSSQLQSPLPTPPHSPSSSRMRHFVLEGEFNTKFQVCRFKALRKEFDKFYDQPAEIDLNLVQENQRLEDVMRGNTEIVALAAILKSRKESALSFLKRVNEMKHELALTKQELAIMKEDLAYEEEMGDDLIDDGDYVLRSSLCHYPKCNKDSLDICDCRKAAYCSKKCQTKHWNKGHEAVHTKMMKEDGTMEVKMEVRDVKKELKDIKKEEDYDDDIPKSSKIRKVECKKTTKMFSPKASTSKDTSDHKF